MTDDQLAISIKGLYIIANFDSLVKVNITLRQAQGERSNLLIFRSC